MDRILSTLLRKRDGKALKQYVRDLESELARTQVALYASAGCRQTVPTQPTGVKDNPVPEHWSTKHHSRDEPTYRYVVEDQVDLICCFRADFRLTFVNQPYAAMRGKRPEELIGQNLLDGVPPEYQAQVIAHLSSLTAHHPIAVNENPTPLPDGSLRWFHWTNRRIEHANGLIEYQGVGRDITQRKKVEEAERQQRQLAEAMRDSLIALTSLLDVDQVIAQILASLRSVVASDASRILLLENGRWRIAYTSGFTVESDAWLRECVCQPAFLDADNDVRPDQPYLYGDTQMESNWQPFPLISWIRSSIGVPIKIRQEVIGFLVVDSATPHFFQAEQLETLQTFAHYAGLALNNAYHTALLERRVAERTAELQASKERIEACMNNSIDGVVLLRPDLQIEHNNMAFDTMFHVGRANCQIRSLLDYIHDDVAQVSLKFQNAIRSGAGRHLEVQARRCDGSVFDAEVSIGQMKSNGGLVCIIRDITQRKQTENALRQSETRFRQLLDVAPVAIVLADPSGQIVLVNNEAETLFGYQRRELLRQPIEILVPEAARASHVANRAAYTAALRVREMSSSLELFARRKDGTQFPVEIQLSYIETAEGPLIMSFVLDITERKRAAETLRQQRDFLQSVIDHIPGIIAVKNRLGNFQLVNRHTAQHFGMTPSLLVGKTADEVNPNSQEVETIRRLTEQVFTHQQALFIPEGLLNGRYYQANFIPLPAATAAEDQVLIVALDITERKESEIALQKALQTEQELSELKSVFITTTSHEFRTPLAIMLTTTETLRTHRQKFTSEQIDQRLDRIANQVQHMKALMEGVFDLARMQARRMSFTPQLCNPMTLGHELLLEFQQLFETTHSLHYLCDETVPLAKLDVHLLRQIFGNLLSNAVKYSTNHKSIVVQLTYHDGALVWTVRDEGIGIPAADMKHLFQPFYRASNVGTIPGTGLGLSIVKEAVELHQGSIKVQSQVDVGTTFVVTIGVG